MIFSHGQLCKTPLRHKEVLEQTVYCTLSQVMCLTNGMAFWRLPYMQRSLWIPWEARNQVPQIKYPCSKCKQRPHISYECTRYRPSSGVTRGTSVWRCVSGLGGISCSALMLSPGSSGGQSLKWLNLALAHGSDILERRSICDAQL